MSIDRLSPYGFAPEYYRHHGEGDGKIPGDWPYAGTPSGDQSFNEWRTEHLAAIRDHLWPEWVDGSGWTGNAASLAYKMTEREIAVMTEEFSKTNILGQAPNHCSSDYTHLDHYEFEDGRLYGTLLDKFRREDENPDKPRIGRNFFLYDHTPKDAPEQAEFLNAIAVSYTGKTNQFYFWFKNRLVRPRPYQVAQVFGQTDFTSRRALTALHSAIVSGHATTGIMIRCGALEQWLDKGNVPELRLESFSQYIMDVGDRRVFAGVHYPTDNISSWSLALSLIPKVFRHADRIGAIVRSAIQEKSRVYKIIDRVYRNDRNLAHTAEFLDQYLKK